MSYRYDIERKIITSLFKGSVIAWFLVIFLNFRSQYPTGCQGSSSLSRSCSVIICVYAPDRCNAS